MFAMVHRIFAVAACQICGATPYGYLANQYTHFVEFMLPVKDKCASSVHDICRGQLLSSLYIKMNEFTFTNAVLNVLISYNIGTRLNRQGNMRTTERRSLRTMVFGAFQMKVASVAVCMRCVDCRRRIMHFRKNFSSIGLMSGSRSVKFAASCFQYIFTNSRTDFSKHGPRLNLWFRR